MAPAPIEVIGAILFGIALVHTFSTQIFERLAHTHPAHAGIWHFLGEVEVVFGFWVMSKHYHARQKAEMNCYDPRGYLRARTWRLAIYR